jgi:hypothetical protein
MLVGIAAEGGCARTAWRFNATCCSSLWGERSRRRWICRAMGQARRANRGGEGSSWASVAGSGNGRVAAGGPAQRQARGGHGAGRAVSKRFADALAEALRHLHSSAREQQGRLGGASDASAAAGDG